MMHFTLKAPQHHLKNACQVEEEENAASQACSSQVKKQEQVKMAIIIMGMRSIGRFEERKTFAFPRAVFASVIINSLPKSLFVFQINSP
ncbi:MAG: hypothetical protein EZS28_003971 [Streblomastix strix]|uniref:Uncharacterized protein n=1 Tax=Streblomastix strix TaxID=222440 RepID=A0A5J4X038_9EUKA|nr:MAG: hypothetical protein EZS28_003971 [Streblomastix strix]